PKKCRAYSCRLGTAHRDRTGWLRRAGFESLHFGLRAPAVDHGLGLCLARRYGTTTFNRDALFDFSSPRAESLAEFRFGDVEIRSLPPQPASPSLTRIKADRARNAAISRYFPHLVWSPCLKSNHGSRILVPCL